MRTLKLVPIIFLILFTGSATFGDEWDKIEASLKSYSIKINNIQEEIRNLVNKKNAIPNDASGQGSRSVILSDIKKKFSELRQTQKDMIREMERVRFEFPEKGNYVQRRYRHIKIKSIEELEKDSSLDAELSKTKRKAEQKYRQ
ncbi:MAG: hypothetical protein IPM57_05425 [Oligoflexia bacterium]|nr:hypothetical protein [Oligoflexia bacterium]